MYNALINPINPTQHNNHHKQRNWCSEGEWMLDSPATSQHDEMILARAEGTSQRQDPHPAWRWRALPPELVCQPCAQLPSALSQGNRGVSPPTSFFLVHLIKHYVSTPTYAHPTSQPSLLLKESQVGFTRLLLLLFNSVRLVNNSASTQPTNKQADNTNGQTGRWKNERQKEKPNGRATAFAGAPFLQAVLQAVPTSSFSVVTLSSHEEAGKFVQLTWPLPTDYSGWGPTEWPHNILFKV